MAVYHEQYVPSEVIPEKYNHRRLTFKLNGEGGLFPGATINNGDTISSAFRKNSGAWQLMPDDYQLTQEPPTGHMTVCYVHMIFKYEPIV